MKWKAVIVTILLVAIFPTQCLVFCQGVANSAVEAARSGFDINQEVAVDD